MKPPATEVPVNTTVVYIAARGHSGSTLIDFVLGAHSRVFGIGELSALFDAGASIRQKGKGGKNRCSCGAPSKIDCPFWSAVARQVMSRHGFSLWDTSEWKADAAEFAGYNRKVLGSIAAVSGCDVLVDSSKKLSRLDALRNTPGISVRPVHLIRSACGIVYSKQRRGKSWAQETIHNALSLANALRYLRGMEHYTLRYEQFVRDPRAEMTSLMRWIGLDYEPAQEEWSEQEHHKFAGNGMRFSPDGTIRSDEKWKTGLTATQKTVIRMVTGAVTSVAAPGGRRRPSPGAAVTGGGPPAGAPASSSLKKWSGR